MTPQVSVSFTPVTTLKFDVRSDKRYSQDISAKHIGIGKMPRKMQDVCCIP